jgi:hypothetical protein
LFPILEQIENDGTMPLGFGRNSGRRIPTRNGSSQVNRGNQLRVRERRGNVATADLRRETEWPYQYLYEQADNFHVVSCTTRKETERKKIVFIDESGEENIQLARTPVAERVHSPIIQSIIC